MWGWQNVAVGSTPVFSLSHRLMAKKIECYLADLSERWVFNFIVTIEVLTVANMKTEVRAEQWFLQMVCIQPSEEIIDPLL